jgi:hypothetical protein
MVAKQDLTSAAQMVVFLKIKTPRSNTRGTQYEL